MHPVVARLRLLRVGLHLLWGALQVALLFGVLGAPSRHALRRAWSRQLLQMLRIEVAAAADRLKRLDGGLVVANHVSFIDIFAINALLPSAFVAKSDVADWPLIGWLARRNDTLFIERGSRSAAHHAHGRMRQALAGGARLAVFPEGTTSNGDRVLPFHGALFQSAIDAAVPVHAIALSYHAGDGSPSDAAAYTGDLGILDCLGNILRAGPLVIRAAHAATFDPPLPARRHLAHDAQQAIALALKATQTAGEAVDPSNSGVFPDFGLAQPLGNEAAIGP